jgi:hypothetical protein
MREAAETAMTVSFMIFPENDDLQAPPSRFKNADTGVTEPTAEAHKRCGAATEHHSHPRDSRNGAER